MTYLKVAIGLGFVAALVCEVLWLMRLDTDPNDWRVLLVGGAGIGLIGVSVAARHSPWRRRPGKRIANSWGYRLLLGALAAGAVWRNLPLLGPALGCDASGSKGWIMRQICADTPSQTRK